MAKKFKLTQQKLDDLFNELEYLKVTRAPEVEYQIKEARSFGDLSENSEYDEAKNEQGRLYSRISEIESILDNYEIIEESTETTNIVAIGRTVVIKDMSTGDQEEYQIVGSQEADPFNGRISDESPLGKALIGAKIKKTVEYDAPIGKVKLKVLEVR